jgi:hypothetical protein
MWPIFGERVLDIICSAYKKGFRVQITKTPSDMLISTKCPNTTHRIDDFWWKSMEIDGFHDRPIKNDLFIFFRLVFEIRWSQISSSAFSTYFLVHIRKIFEWKSQKHHLACSFPPNAPAHFDQMPWRDIFGRVMLGFWVQRDWKSPVFLNCRCVPGLAVLLWIWAGQI